MKHSLNVLLLLLFSLAMRLLSLPTHPSLSGTSTSAVPPRRKEVAGKLDWHDGPRLWDRRVPSRTPWNCRHAEVMPITTSTTTSPRWVNWHQQWRLTWRRRRAHYCPRNPTGKWLSTSTVVVQRIAEDQWAAVWLQSGLPSAIWMTQSDRTFLARLAIVRWWAERETRSCWEVVSDSYFCYLNLWRNGERIYLQVSKLFPKEKEPELNCA